MSCDELAIVAADMSLYTALATKMKFGKKNIENIDRVFDPVLDKIYMEVAETQKSKKEA